MIFIYMRVKNVEMEKCLIPPAFVYMCESAYEDFFDMYVNSIN